MPARAVLPGDYTHDTRGLTDGTYQQRIQPEDVHA